MIATLAFYAVSPSSLLSRLELKDLSRFFLGIKGKAKDSHGGMPVEIYSKGQCIMAAFDKERNGAAVKPFEKIGHLSLPCGPQKFKRDLIHVEWIDSHSPAQRILKKS